MAEKRPAGKRRRTVGRGVARKRERPGLRDHAPEEAGTVDGTDGAPSPSPGADVPSGLIDMNEAIAMLRTTRPTFYRWLRSGRLRGSKAGRQWRFRREDIERFLSGREPRIELRADIDPLTDMLRRRIHDLSGKDPLAVDVDEPRRAVIMMFHLAALMRAIDVHLAPMAALSGGIVAPLRYRVDGVLHHIVDVDVRLLPALIEQLKIMAGCDIHEKGRPQDGRIIVHAGDGRDIDVRVCFLPTGIGDSMTARIAGLNDMLPSLDRIAFAQSDKQRLLRGLEAPAGLIIVGGPAGCGKTTVLYACVSHLARPDLHVLSLEDPIEFRLPGVVQIEINEAAGFTFTAGLRALMRSDPDVVMIGEIRDVETVRVAIQLATTGHLVLTQMHTEDTGATLQRLLDVGIEPYCVADAVKVVISQRLVRLLCRKCACEYSPPVDMLRRAEDLARGSGLNWDAIPKRFRRPVGCPECGNTGYNRRTPIAEVLEVNSEMAAALRQGAAGQDIRRMAVREGMTTITGDAVRRASEGVTSLEEILGVVGGLARV